MLNQTAEYALRAVLHIAEHGSERPVAVQDIAEALDVPRNYLSKTLHQLARAGVVSSSFGPGGGFRLAVPAEQLSLETVVAPFDVNGIGERHCLLGGAKCSDATACAAHEHWKHIAAQIQQFFARTTVAQLAREPEADMPFLPRASRPRRASAR